MLDSKLCHPTKGPALLMAQVRSAEPPTCQLRCGLRLRKSKASPQVSKRMLSKSPHLGVVLPCRGGTASAFLIKVPSQSILERHSFIRRPCHRACSPKPVFRRRSPRVACSVPLRFVGTSVACCGLDSETARHAGFRKFALTPPMGFKFLPSVRCSENTEGFAALTTLRTRPAYRHSQTLRVCFDVQSTLVLSTVARF